MPIHKQPQEGYSNPHRSLTERYWQAHARKVKEYVVCDHKIGIHHIRQMVAEHVGNWYPGMSIHIGNWAAGSQSWRSPTTEDVFDSRGAAEDCGYNAICAYMDGSIERGVVDEVGMQLYAMFKNKTPQVSDLLLFL